MVWGEWERKEAELISPPNLSQSKGIFCRIIIMSALLGFTMKRECISNFTWFTGEEDRKSRNSWKSGKIELIPRLPACVLYSATEIAEPLTAIIVHDLYFSLIQLNFQRDSESSHFGNCRGYCWIYKFLCTCGLRCTWMIYNKERSSHLTSSLCPLYGPSAPLSSLSVCCTQFMTV